MSREAASSPAALSAELAAHLRVGAVPTVVAYDVAATKRRDGYHEMRIEYPGEEGDRIPAFLLVPEGDAPTAGVVVQHQHASQWHLGKSEVAGLAGDPLQAFGPALARGGVVVLAPDSICFEDRRSHACGTTPGEDRSDWFHHFNAMAHRLVRGDTLMRRVLRDAMLAVSVLRGLPRVDPGRIGTLGHSYGGNTVLFHAAVDASIRFACASGAACSYRRKLAAGTGIEMAEVLPGFAARWDIEDLVRAICPRPLLLVSGASDRYSEDADDIVARSHPAYAAASADEALVLARDDLGHAMTAARFERIVAWTLARARAS